MEVQTTFRFGELEAILADINEIPSKQRTAFAAKLKDLSRLDLLRMANLPKGKAATYGLRELALLAVAVEMCQFGLSTKRAVEVMLTDEYPLWMATMMAADAIIARPEVFNPGPGDTGNPPEQEMWGFSPDWNDNKDTDPLSMFLYFDPSVLAPWGEAGGGEEGQDIASATFFYAGAGIVADSIGRWTTGPTRRIALINMTKLIFDLSAYLAGTEGIVVCKEFSAVAQSYVHRGDFDLDGWIAQVAKSGGMRVAANPDRSRPFVDLKELVEGLREPASKYVFPVVQMPAEGEPDYVKDRRIPDLVIRLPGQRELLVDNKVSPVADIPQRGIEWRVQELADEPYRSQFRDRTKWVVLYVPNEDFLANAMAADNALIDRALAQNVLIATPSILSNLLAEVVTAWEKYREELPDLWADEDESLGTPRHRPWPHYTDVGTLTGKKFAEMDPEELLMEMRLFRGRRDRSTTGETDGDS